ncbi:protein MAIN-LIKE 2-like [Lycium ferocissimum]|uniref:protein MAIN-LIKE 2-like n=1 Tax=Lycium ferocissimum TaxID=112874 RepID=UPI0028166F17|nr:protein MAIN-LIKE 2-like [Lycium ferocissimum]
MDLDPLHPGPFEPEVLHLQQHHRSQLVWDVDVAASLLFLPRLMEQAWDILDAWPPHRRVLDILYQGNIYRCVVPARIQHDRPLVTAMIERWRPKTYTFHLCTGEATITLQDVEIIYGLQGDMWGQSRMSTYSLSTHLRLIDMEHPITEDTPQMNVDRRARLYLLFIFRGILFPNTSGSHVSLRYLPFLEHLGKLGCYSWGAAILAYMYRGFCRAFMGSRTDVAAFCPLLHIWARTRRRLFQPIVVHPLLDYIVEAVPYARRWTRGVIRDVDKHHRVLRFRDQLDRMTADTITRSRVQPPVCHPQGERPVRDLQGGTELNFESLFEDFDMFESQDIPAPAPAPSTSLALGPAQETAEEALSLAIPRARRHTGSFFCTCGSDSC